MAAASHSVRCKMEYPEAGFAAGQSCFICAKADSPVESNLFGRVQVVVSGSASTHLLVEKDLVHLSCHSDKPFHYGCMQIRLLKQPLPYLLQGISFCPFDGHEMTTISSRTDQISAIDNSSALDRRISTVALTDIVLLSKSSINEKDAVHKMAEANKAFAPYKW